MPRTKTVVPGRKRRRKVMIAVKGNRGGRRKLWIVRINAAARAHGLSYNAFIRGLKTAQVEIDRKVLADLAIRDAQAFARLAEVAKQAHAAA